MVLGCGQACLSHARHSWGRENDSKGLENPPQISFSEQKDKNLLAKVRSKLKMERSQLSPIIKEDLKETRGPKTMESFNVYNGDQNAT